MNITREILKMIRIVNIDIQNENLHFTMPLAPPYWQDGGMKWVFHCISIKMGPRAKLSITKI